MSQNSITFLPATEENTKILYYSATTEKWHNSIEQKYTSQFRVIPPKLEEQDDEILCKDNCHFYNTRFEADNLIWLFLLIRYLAVIDCIVNLFYNLVVIQQFNQMLDEYDVTSGVANEEMKLDDTIQTLNKNQPQSASDASLVSQNNGYEHWNPKEAAQEEQAVYEKGTVNAEIQEILTDIKVKKMAKKYAAAR